jgi:hypothetical protein
MHEAQDVIEIVESFDSVPVAEELERLRWLPNDSFEPTLSAYMSETPILPEFSVRG